MPQSYYYFQYNSFLISIKIYCYRCESVVMGDCNYFYPSSYYLEILKITLK